MFNFNIDDEAFKAFKYELISEVKKELTFQEEIFKTSEAAEFLKISKPTLYKLINSNSIPFIKIGDQKRFRKSDLLNLGKN
ncbi:helix-turn-helix domain-containing protein [Cyclobacteriaceae bacterium]|jgi:excisionase family DNA binding protein|nr:helix-turn-helix domain-containing protein [Cyclobacteriaceae bacterium]|tara:strand:+ start:227 stop:469 length:243 start_codon:yes stop_codon:yes gene_type:complete